MKLRELEHTDLSLQKAKEGKDESLSPALVQVELADKERIILEWSEQIPSLHGTQQQWVLMQQESSRKSKDWQVEALSSEDLVELKRVRKQELETKVARADDEVKRATESRVVLQEEQLRDANLALGLLEVKKDEVIACSDALHAGLMDLETSQSIIVLTGEADIKVEASEEAATCAKRVVGNWEVSERVDKTLDLARVQAQTKSVKEADDRAKRWVITKKEKMKVLWEHVRERGEMLESEQLRFEASQSFPLVDKLKDRTEDRKAVEVQMSDHSKEQLPRLLFEACVCVARYAITFIHLVVYLELAVMGSGWMAEKKILGLLFGACAWLLMGFVWDHARIRLYGSQLSKLVRVIASSRSMQRYNITQSYAKMVDAWLVAKRGLMSALNDAYEAGKGVTRDDWEVGIQWNFLNNSVPGNGPMNLRGVDRSMGVSAPSTRDGSIDGQPDGGETKLGSLQKALERGQEGPEKVWWVAKMGRLRGQEEPEQARSLVSLRGRVDSVRPDCSRKPKRPGGARRDMADLVEDAGKLDPVTGREDVVRRVIHISSRETKNNLVLIREPGVGKAEGAKALGEQLSDDENHPVKIDMPEYMEQHSVARLIRARPGYSRSRSMIGSWDLNSEVLAGLNWAGWLGLKRPELGCAVG
ncbi:hypothetical protein L7F22_055700 [Adiantum nelumboides]|nr:hypothetical protein [Adiantum nelumboides]